jgi:prevent-host-death family protein
LKRGRRHVILTKIQQLKVIIMDARVSEFAVAEAKARFSELLDRAENGEAITIKRHGKPIVKLVAVGSVLTVEDRRRERLEWIAQRGAPNGPRLAPGETIKDLINEGRKY